MLEHENLIKVKFENLLGVFYNDYLMGEKFYNLEIYKDNKCLRHITLANSVNEDYIYNYLKEFAQI